MILADIGNGDVLLWMIEFFFLVIILSMVFQIIGDIFRSEDLSGGMKAVWCIAIILVPWLAIFIYLIARGSGMTQRSIAAHQKAQTQFDEYARQTVGATEPTAQIASAKQLLDAGAITQDEFDQLKQKALASA